MCGIAGIVLKTRNQRVNEDILDKMCGVIRHRGPDEAGKWIKNYVGIGMRRLSIIDLNRGSQPIHNEDKSVWIVFNGEIYNFIDLRSDLKKRGHIFYTSSDTEVIVHLYEEYNEDCVHHLRGMFAFAIWDQKEEKLFLARDRLGIKPLHYFDDGKKFLFGSEIKSIIAVPDIVKRVYHPSIVTYFAYGYTPDPDTMFEGIYKLPPGHYLVHKKRSTKIQRYWDIKFNYTEVKSEEYYIERVMDILNESVKMRLISDVPLGAFLSGGIDSSIVVALMAQNLTKPVKTFSIGFDEKEYDELKYARMVAERYGTDHHEEFVTPDANTIIPELVRQFDEPFADSSAIPTYYVCKMTRKWVTVALSGDGGDELFGGYPRYLNGPPVRYTRWLPKGIRKKVFLNFAKILPEGFPFINTMRHIAGDSDERYLRSITKGVSSLHKIIFSEELKEKISHTDPSKLALNYLKDYEEYDQLTRRQYLDLKTYLPGDILTKVDRTSMLVSLEVRVPLLDHKLVEFTASIPPEMKVKGITTKYLLKKVAERLIPKEVIYRPKMGFAVPIANWIKNEWSEQCYDLVLGERALGRKNFKKKFLNRIMQEHRWGRRDHSHLIWTLMVLELWYREMIDNH